MTAVVAYTHTLIDDVLDMPDRIIAATALALDLPVVTRDFKIRQSRIVSIW